jgi:hypothetical protein
MIRLSYRLTPKRYVKGFFETVDSFLKIIVYSFRIHKTEPGRKASLPSGARGIIPEAVIIVIIVIVITR